MCHPDYRIPLFARISGPTYRSSCSFLPRPRNLRGWESSGRVLSASFITYERRRAHAAMLGQTPTSFLSSSEAAITPYLEPKDSPGRSFFPLPSRTPLLRDREEIEAEQRYGRRQIVDEYFSRCAVRKALINTESSSRSFLELLLRALSICILKFSLVRDV